ncbi:MAG: AAA-like domain-containing protein [Rivularia sp. (in: Bacteria)]|nr:AAA-like domain-containing protein [Rivularia sp. MS3]
MDNTDEILEFIENIIFINTGEHLNDTQKIILEESWNKSKKTYEQIAAELGYAGSYIKQGVGPKLWRLLSKTFGEKVTKINLHSVVNRWIKSKANQQSYSFKKSPQLSSKKQAELESAYLAYAESVNQENKKESSCKCVYEDKKPLAGADLEFPQDSVALDSALYISRGNHEERCYQTILNPGAFIRIKAPRQMGKTSLMNRVLAYAAKEEKYKTALLHFQQADSSILTDFNRLLRWICINLTRQLKLESDINDYWDEELGSKMSCNLYIQACVLQQIDSPLVLALEEVNEIIEHPQIAKEFFSLLRFWHERTKADANWQKLRLIMVHSTEIYIPLDINQSPLNVGLRIELEPFNKEQVQELMLRHQLDLNADDLNKLTNLVGGHPYLTRLAFYYLKCQELTFTELLETAATDAGIYRDVLQRNLRLLYKDNELVEAFKAVLDADEPIALEQIQGFKLHSMGLINYHGNQVFVSCDLYRQYFQEYLNYKFNR